MDFSSLPESYPCTPKHVKPVAMRWDQAVSKGGTLFSDGN